VSKKRRPPELTAAETAQVMKNVQEMLERERVIQQLQKKVDLFEKLKAIQPASTEIVGLKSAFQQTFIGKPWGNRQCPVWLPQDPAVPHNQRKQCVCGSVRIPTIQTRI
jgi:hypothetical protein